MQGDSAMAELVANPGFLLSRVGTAVQAGFKTLLGKWDVRPLHFAILVALGSVEGTSQKRLGDTVGVDSGNLVELIDLLEARGYTQRHRDPADRRRYIVGLTADGRTALSEMVAAVQEYTATFLAPLDESEQQALVATLAKLYATTPEGRGRR